MIGRPILMSAPMVRAILAGTKTQTRRLVKSLHASGADDWAHVNGAVWHSGVAGDFGSFGLGESVKCPYGAVGDRLWVKETWALLTGNGHRVVFRADADPPMTCGDTEPVRDMKWTPSIYMPRAQSRITLEVTDVRVERVQSISDADARAEGIAPLPLQSADDPSAWWSADPSDPCLHGRTPSKAFAMLWASINGATSWDADVWVWVLAFRRVE